MRRLGRRRFVQSILGGVALGALRPRAWGADVDAGELSGSDIALSIDELPVRFTGRQRTATAVNGRVPAPLLRLRQGDTVALRVTNRLRVPSSIHWHGLIVPADMDGVPGVSFAGIAPGATFVYRFKLSQHGTYWYHAHSRFQEQTGLYGPLVIEPREARRAADREYTLLLSDWTDVDPELIYATLKKHSDAFNYGKRTTADFIADVRAKGFEATLTDRLAWGGMRMDPTDVADVTGHVYTYLLNGVAPDGNWTGVFQRGERVRLRLINGSSMSFFDLRIPGLALRVVAADGQEVEPVTVDELRIGAAEVYDVIVEPDAERAYTIFAQAMDRSGYARGTLAPRPGMSAEVPALDARALLTMADMGHGGASPAAMDHSTMDHSTMDHSAMGQGGTNQATVTHAPAEHGPGVDMLVAAPAARLDDPGLGLRGNGRRVLTYADLHTVGGPIDRREPTRELELHLTGHMERYIWSFNGQKFSQAEPLRFTHGERLRIVLVNDTMMTHPIHLHGMWSELVDAGGTFLVRKHTVSVQPAQRLAYEVTADAPGHWAYHCHLLYHMEAGMFREVVVAHGGAHEDPEGHRG